MRLYPYQRALVGSLAKALAAHRRVMLQLPTGGGKTVVAAKIVDRWRRAGQRVWIICHRQELCEQASSALVERRVPHGFIAAGREMEPGRAVQICSVMSLGRRLDYLEPPDLVIWDEAHHIAAGTWARIMETFSEARHLGLSATPERLDGKPLGEWFDDLICGPTSEELEAQGFIAPYRYFAPTNPDLLNLKVARGDYDRGQIGEAMGRRAIIGEVVEHYARIAKGRPALCFAASIESSKGIVARFNAAGIPAAHVDGTTPAEERARTVERLRAGTLKILSNVEVFTEGLDIPSVGALILLRPTRSTALCLQMVGRGRRVSADYEDLIILDHAGLYYDHGLPNEARAWVLDGRREKRARAGASIAMRRCPECSAVHGWQDTCPECGHVYTEADRSIAEIFGELREVEADPDRESQRAFAKRMGVTASAASNWKKRGLPMEGGLVMVPEAVEWVHELWANYQKMRKDLCREQMSKLYADPAFRKASAELMKQRHADPAFRKANAERSRELMKKRHTDPAFRAACVDRLRQFNPKRRKQQ